ncbi:MAG: large conductance mechanosensitive channel [Pseudonocardiales bacterium]|nr:large conductance mechanosensitive channel [Pseudonocardiales bacterium]
MLKGFKEFIMRGNVVDLAVAVVIGTAFTAVVTALVKDLLTPVIAAIFGKPNFSNLFFTVHKSRFLYGEFINAALQFVLIAAAVYFFVIVPIKAMTELRLRRRAAGEPADVADLPSDEAVLLREIRDLLSAQRPN